MTHLIESIGTSHSNSENKIIYLAEVNFFLRMETHAWTSTQNFKAHLYRIFAKYFLKSYWERQLIIFIRIFPVLLIRHANEWFFWSVFPIRQCRMEVTWEEPMNEISSFLAIKTNSEETVSSTCPLEILLKETLENTSEGNILFDKK